jgi:hypothetical protein
VHVEFLTIFYAMLAALTGVSVGEAAPARQLVVSSSNAAQMECASAAHSQRAVATPIAVLPDALALVQSAVADLPFVSAEAFRPIAWIDLARRHL